MLWPRGVIFQGLMGIPDDGEDLSKTLHCRAGFFFVVGLGFFFCFSFLFFFSFFLGGGGGGGVILISCLSTTNHNYMNTLGSEFSKIVLKSLSFSFPFLLL